jgi:hypothetical protein
MTPEELEAQRQANEKAEGERKAREANQKRNDARLERFNAIADSADEVKNEEDDLVPLTDEVWDQQDRPEDARRKTRAERIAEQDEAEEDEGPELGEDGKPLTEEEAAARVLRRAQDEDRSADAARHAGATDVRKVDGVTQYKVGVKWLTLAQLRELGGEPEGGEGDLHADGEGDTTPPARSPSPTAQEREAARVEAERVAKEARDARKAQLRDLYTRVSMGDEEAIDLLAEMQADQSRVTPDLQQLVNEQVDARMTGRSDFQKAVDWFESEAGFADVLVTPRLKQEAGRLDKELATQYPELSPRQRLERVGKQMRQLREDLGVAPRGKGPTPPTPATKLQRKAQAARAAPEEAAGRQRQDEEPDETQSTQDAIRQMAMGRGQARAITHKH